jgi:hypothetical protein
MQWKDLSLLRDRYGQVLRRLQLRAGAVENAKSGNRWSVLAVLACLFSQTSGAYWSGKISTPLWSIGAPSGTVRWLEIHNLATAKADGLYHIEILERRSIDPPWKFRSLARHMAVTEEALRASAIAPFKRGSVYPETYDAAFEEWKIANASNNAFICKTTIAACLAETPN